MKCIATSASTATATPALVAGFQVHRLTAAMAFEVSSAIAPRYEFSWAFSSSSAKSPNSIGRLGNISGKLSAETSGGSVSAILSSPVVGDVRLETSAGSMTVVTPANAALTIDAETSAGSVRSDLPISRDSSDHDSLKGTLNGGGTKLVLRSSAGSIEIVAADKKTAQE